MGHVEVKKHDSSVSGWAVGRVVWVERILGKLVLCSNNTQRAAAFTLGADLSPLNQLRNQPLRRAPGNGRGRVRSSASVSPDSEICMLWSKSVVCEMATSTESAVPVCRMSGAVLFKG